MINPLLRNSLRPLARRQSHLRLWSKLAACWGAAALVGLGLVSLQRSTGWGSPLVLPALALASVVAAIVIATRHSRRSPDWRALAQQVEARHPELNGLLLTAVQQEVPPGGQLGYLQERVILEAFDRSRASHWARIIPWSRVATAHVAHVLALGLFGLVLVALRTEPRGPGFLALGTHVGVTVTPGDTSLERGSSLVVMARFGGTPPAHVDLVIEEDAGGTRRLPLVKSLADPMFGASVPDVTTDLTYRLEYGGRHTRDFRVKVFEHPRLERADVDLTFPDYTRLEPKRIEDTRRVSAVEGTRLDLSLRFNKPVASAQLVPKGTNQPALRLATETNAATASLRQFALDTSATYQLQLVDAEGRTNKVPAQFVFEALRNRPPELKLASPRGDLRPSALEEITFEGTVWDDFGVQAYGVAYSVGGEAPRTIELGGPGAAREKKAFRHVLRLEDLGVEPDQFLSWFVWADDLGPDGEVRRTTGDLFFAEVRPFDEIFREGEGNEGQGRQGEQAGQPGEESGRLAELQKQIISATWKLQQRASAEVPARRSGDVGGNSVPPSGGAAYAADAGVVRDSQGHALEQARAEAGEASDPRTATWWEAAITEMEKALERLEEAVRTPAPLPEALAAEQAAYQALLKLQQREYAVARSRSNRGQAGQSGRQQAMQRQLDQLDLAQSENRYETQRQASAPQSPEQRERLQALNRLRELARRQEDLNERLRELQTALQEARTEQEREELRRRLKRLQEDEQQMLADVDELRQRMDRPENQSQMAEAREQLDQTREEIQRAAEAAGEGSASQALAAGTRAQRQMQNLRDQLRQESASEFAEALREMRADARELARQQAAVEQQLDALEDPRRKTLSDAAERDAALARLAEQAQRLTNLVARATEVSQQAETAEPLVSRELYDTLRQFSQDDASAVKQFQEELLERGMLTRSLYERLQQTAEGQGAKAIEVTAELLRQGYLSQAGQAGERARAGVDQLRRGVERAAERVLGDDAEALRLADQQLERLTEQLEREIAQAEGGANREPTPEPGSQRPRQGERRPQGAEGDEPPQPGDGGDERARDLAQAGAGQEQPSEANPGNQTPAAEASDAPESAGARNSGRAGRSSANPSPGQEAPQTAQAERNEEGQQGGTRGGRRATRSLRDAGSRGGPESLADGDRDGGWLDGFDSVLGGPEFTGTGPLTGEDFAPWSDRLREVEEMVEFPSLRSEIATARERARQMRQEFRRERKKPDWAVVRLEVVRPLVEVRREIQEELARRAPEAAMVPIDRDPVPHRFADLVKRYYEELGKAK